MPEEIDIVKFGTLKRYINDVLEMQVSDTGTENVMGRFNDLIKNTLRKAMEDAREEDRERILIRHLEKAMDENLGESSLDPEAIFKEVRTLGPIEIGDLVKLINDYIDEQKTQVSE